MPAVEIARRALDGKIHVAKLFVGRQRRPRAGVPGVGPGIVQPGVVAELAGLRNRVEGPQPLARAHVPAADEALRVLFRARRGARQKRAAGHDDVFHHHRRRAGSDGAVLRRRLIEIVIHVEHAVLAEARHGNAGLRVQLDHVETLSDDNDPLIPSAGIRPVFDAASGLPRRHVAALPFVQPIHPQRFAGRAIDRDDVAAGSRDDVEHAIDGDRRRFVVAVEPGSIVVGLPPPRNAQRLRVVAVDLIERRVLGVPEVGSPVGPVTGLGAALCGYEHRRRDDSGQRQHRQGGAHRSPEHSDAPFRLTSKRFRADEEAHIIVRGVRGVPLKAAERSSQDPERQRRQRMGVGPHANQVTIVSRSGASATAAHGGGAPCEPNNN